jgi:hypothetical protein
MTSTLQVHKQRSAIAPPPSSHPQQLNPLHSSSSAHITSSERNIFSDHLIHHDQLPAPSHPSQSSNTFKEINKTTNMSSTAAPFSTADWNALPDQITSTETAQTNAFLVALKARQQASAAKPAGSPYELSDRVKGRYEKATKTDENTTVTANVNTGRNQSSITKESRFFPRADALPASEKADSPPPPEVSSLVRTQKNPVVNLPKPQAVVKLPPAKASPQKKTIAPVAPPFLRWDAGVEPGKAWQNKFDSLFGRDTKDATEPVTVNSSSRAPLNQSKLLSGATVSLPLSKVDGKSGLVVEVQAKSTDEDLFAQPEFGSRPVIDLPKNPHLNSNLAAIHFMQVVRRGLAKHVDAASRPEWTFVPEVSTINVRVPGRDGKTVALLQSRTNSNGSRGYRSNNSNNWYNKKSHGQGGNKVNSGPFNGGRNGGRNNGGNNGGGRGKATWPKRNTAATPSATVSN